MKNKIDSEFIKDEFQKIQNYFLSKKFDKVIEKTKVLLKKDPYQVPFYNLIGLSYRQTGKYKEAEDIFLKGLKIFSKNLSILSNLGSLYKSMIQFKKAEFYLLEALKLKNDDFNTLINYANLKRDLNQNKESILFYEKAYEINKKNEPLLLNLASAYQIDGNFELSKKILKQCLNFFPNKTKADLMLSSVTKYKKNDEHMLMMLEKLKNKLLINDKVYLYFAIAKAYADMEDYSNCSHYLKKANLEQQIVLKNYDFQNEVKKFIILKKLFNEVNFNNSKQNTKHEPNLIFIVGLPRSGTTLTHQIVSSHSKIYGAGELPILNIELSKKIKDREFLDLFSQSINSENKNFIQNYAENLEKKFKEFDNKIILDKSPLNFMWIGFIKIFFPKAKIIHCKRNLKDVALSIYKNYFDGGSIPWGYNEKNLSNFIEEYENLMDYWNKKMPSEIYECKYENMVNNQAQEIKDILKFCNLNWEESCLDHTKNKTGIKTVSISQARQPVYKSSVNLNENYLKHLGFLKKIG